MSGLELCPVCEEPVAHRAVVEGFVGWESPAGELERDGVIVVVHSECFLRLTPDEGDELLDRVVREML